MISNDEAIQRQSDVLAYLQSLQSGSPPVVVPPVVVPPVVTPPVEPPASGGYPLGDFFFDSQRRITTGVTGGVWSYARVVVPDPLPDGWRGKSTSFSIYEYDDGQYSMKLYASRTLGNMSGEFPYYGEGNSPSVRIKFEEADESDVVVRAGETWYFMIKHERLNGQPSVPAGKSCNFAITCYVPS